MPAPSAIVLILDRLGAGLLGPYGATWLDTPNFNRLAAGSLLCENVVADAPSLELAYRAYGLGLHAMSSDLGRAAWEQWRGALTDGVVVGSTEPNVERGETSESSLGELAAAKQVQTVLLTDDPHVARFAGVRDFSEQIVLPSPDAAVSATDVAETSLAAIFEAAVELLPQLKPPFVLWIHARALAGPWDAPLELRNKFADEDDPPPPPLVEPPEALLPAEFDPDETLGYSHAYAGQVTLLDMCLGMLLDEIDSQPWADETALVATSPRGYPLGQHRRVGACDEALYAELIHVPLLLRLPGGRSELERRQTLVQPADLHATLIDWLQLAPVELPSTSGRSLLRLLDGRPFADPQMAVALGPNQRLIRTPAWLLRETWADGRLLHELFLKPDDYWEVNEVATRCREVVVLLAAELDRFHAQNVGCNTTPLAPLAEVLVNTVR